jgi:hypothetical protein
MLHSLRNLSEVAFAARRFSRDTAHDLQTSAAPCTRVLPADHGAAISLIAKLGDKIPGIKDRL